MIDPVSEKVELLSDKERKLLLIDRLIEEFYDIQKGLVIARSTPDQILDIYMGALIRLFNASCAIILSITKDNVIRAVKIHKDLEETDIDIKTHDNIKDAEDIVDLFRNEFRPYTAKRKLDTEEALSKRGIKSYFAAQYQYKGEKWVLMIANFSVGHFRDSIESYEAKLASITMELLYAEADATYFNEKIEELMSALNRARISGSRLALNTETKRTIDFCSKYHYSIGDSTISDYLDTTLSRLGNPGQEAIPEDVKSKLLSQLSETFKGKDIAEFSDELIWQILSCFEAGIIDGKLPASILQSMPLSMYSLCRVLSALSMEFSDDSRQFCQDVACALLARVENPFARSIGELSDLHDNIYIACLQARWMDIITFSEHLRSLKTVSDDDVDILEDLVKDTSPDTRILLWKALSFISDNNYTEQGTEKAPREGTNIESLWLKTWFCHHTLEPERLEDFFKDSTRSRLSIISVCHELGIYVLYFLHRLKTMEARSPVIFLYGSEGAARALFYLIAEYAHSSCDVPRSIWIYENIKKAWETEAVLYLSRMPHRDHIFHSIDVALLGLLLLHVRCHGDDEPLIQKVVTKFHDDRKEVLANWLLATLFHDIGYSFVLYESTGKVVDFFEASSLKEGGRIIADAINDAKNRIRADAADRFSDILPKPLSKINHGIVSAIHLDHIFKEKTYGTALSDRYRQALHAIISHDYKGFPISCVDNPLSFLLLLCDHLQDWSRPRVDTSKLRRGVAVSLDYRQPFQTDAYHNMAYLTLNLQIESDKIRYKDDILKFVLVYKKPNSDNYEPVMLWLDSTYDLHRANHLMLWDRIEFAIDIVEQSQHREIDNARDFILQEKAGIMIMNWLEAVTKVRNFVKYDRSVYGERLTINISGGTPEPLEDKRPDDLYNTFVQWKHKRANKISLGTLKFLCDLDEK